MQTLEQQKLKYWFQVQLPLFEELITRSTRLQSQLSSLVTVFTGFLETAEKICYHAVESKSDPELGVCLERIVTRHRNMEIIMKTLTRYHIKYFGSCYAG